jgi:hypothetical protein
MLALCNRRYLYFVCSYVHIVVLGDELLNLHIMNMHVVCIIQGVPEHFFVYINIEIVSKLKWLIVIHTMLIKSLKRDIFRKCLTNSKVFYINLKI